MSEPYTEEDKMMLLSSKSKGFHLLAQRFDLEIDFSKTIEHKKAYADDISTKGSLLWKEAGPKHDQKSVDDNTGVRK